MADRIEPAQISYAQKYEQDRQRDLARLQSQGQAAPKSMMQPMDWGHLTGSVNSQMVDNPNYVDTSKGSVMSYSGDKLSYAPKGSTYFTDTDVTESDLTPELMADIYTKMGSAATNPAFAGMSSKYKGLMESETAKQLGAADPTLFGGSSFSLAPDVLNKMWR